MSDLEGTSETTQEPLPEKSTVRFARLLGGGENTERTIFFSDAVMAIAMTLLVLEITVPESSTVSGAELPEAILADATAFSAYALSFALIGINWITHHRKFTVIERYDARLQWINLGYLFFIAVLPLTTRILSDYGAVTIAVIMYAAVISLTSVFQFWLWSYAHRAGLFSDVVDEEMYRYTRQCASTADRLHLLDRRVSRDRARHRHVQLVSHDSRGHRGRPLSAAR